MLNLDNNKEKILKKLAEKLKEKLKTVPAPESDVVYVLSMIRKVLEIDNSKTFSVLKFYCNLALHVKIDRPLPKSISDMLVRIKDGGTNPKAYSNSIIGFNDLHKQLKNFLKKYNLSNIIYTEKYGVKKFRELLLGIYSDIPVILTIEEKFEISLNDKGDDLQLISIKKL